MVIIVSMDKNQIEHSIKEIYGEIDVDTYLRKFISFKVNLDNGKATQYIKKFERNTGLIRNYREMIKIIFVCHGRMLKNSEKAYKINGFTARKGVYYIVWEGV